MKIKKHEWMWNGIVLSKDSFTIEFQIICLDLSKEMEKPSFRSRSGSVHTICIFQRLISTFEFFNLNSNLVRLCFFSIWHWPFVYMNFRDKFAPIKLVKRALGIFLQSKHRIDRRHRFALMFIHGSSTWVWTISCTTLKYMISMYYHGKLVSWIYPCCWEKNISCQLQPKNSERHLHYKFKTLWQGIYKYFLV